MSDEQAIIPMEEYKRLKGLEQKIEDVETLNSETINDWANHNQNKLPIRYVHDTAKADREVRFASGLALVCMALAFLGVYQWGWGWLSVIPGFFFFIGLAGVWMETE